MKTEDHLLIYDKDCPFCCWYTQLFIRNGLLQQHERMAYSDAIQSSELHFNHNKARNKIAFIHTGNGEITYGIDSLLTIIGRKFPWMKRLGSLFPFHVLLGLLYNFLSYNRKMIAAVDCRDQCGCVPEKSLFWRFAFIGFSFWIVTVAFLLQLENTNNVIYSYLIPITYTTFLFIIQGLLYILLGNKQLYDYLGHLAFVLMASSFLFIISYLTSFFLVDYFIDPAIFQSFITGCSLTMLLYLHNRRLKLLHASRLLTITLIFSLVIPIPFIINLFNV